MKRTMMGCVLDPVVGPAEDGDEFGFTGRPILCATLMSCSVIFTAPKFELMRAMTWVLRSVSGCVGVNREL